ncbi:MAG: enoyl-CoA hydratase/isomerase family protein [Chloroflexi bacterium]|nr:enoyl-CoA hydratase/isomerase family protein [Chloroflexota bacterium]
MAYESEFVNYTLEGHVATIAMNRPERLNAYGSQMREDMTGAWAEAVGDDNVRVIILTGEGRIFCAGRDIREQAERGSTLPPPPSAAAAALNYFGVPDTDKPIIAAVRGGAWGQGWFMACGSDIVISADDARFAMSEIPTGIIGPAFIPLKMNIPWLVGSEIVLRGHQISAQQAYDAGLLNHVVPSDQVMTLAREIAEEIAALPPRHVQVTKRQLAMARPEPSYYQSEVAFAQGRDELMALDDTREAAQAFAEKRTPVFHGR